MTTPARHGQEEAVQRDDKSLRQTLLNGKKTERIIFAVTPEMKKVLAAIAEDQCTSVSGLLTSLAMGEISTKNDVACHALSDMEVER